MKTRRDFLLAIPLLILACTNPKKRELTDEENAKIKENADKYHQEMDKKLISEGNPIAATLKYHTDGLTASALLSKSTSNGVPAEKQICSTCMYYKAIGDDYGSCQMLPMGNVAANGWCLSWVKNRDQMPSDS